MYFPKKLYSPLCHLSYACMNACTRAYVDLKVCVSVCEQHGVSLTGAGQWVIIRPATSHLSKQSLYTHTRFLEEVADCTHIHTALTYTPVSPYVSLSISLSLLLTHIHTSYRQFTRMHFHAHTHCHIPHFRVKSHCFLTSCKFVLSTGTDTLCLTHTQARTHTPS